MPKAAIPTDASLQNYRLLGLVGQGQFAQVYCAIHRKTGQLVAIKQIRHTPENTSQEPLILAQLNHPNLVACHAIAHTPTGSQKGHSFILEYCEGSTLRSHLTRTPSLSFPVTKSLITNILQGLIYLHQRSIIHNDLKPENIFLTHASNGHLTAKIGDFGHARFTASPNRSRQEIGSPTYAAPERFSGQSSYASDLYAVGIMLYEMLIGDRPFSGSPSALQQAHQSQPAFLPNKLHYKTRQLLMTALHKQPEHRFKSAEAMLIALQETHEPSRKAPRLLPATDVSQAIAPFPTTDTSQPINSSITPPQSSCTTTQQHPSKVVQTIALNNRYLLQIRTFKHLRLTHLECFTRKGRFIAQLPLNLRIAQAALSALPYQLIAKTTESEVLLIALKPFQVSYLSTDIKARYVSALPWGYIAGNQTEAVVFDRSGNAASRLTNLPLVSAIAALNNHTLLLTSDSKTASYTADLRHLDIGIIF